VCSHQKHKIHTAYNSLRNVLSSSYWGIFPTSPDLLGLVPLFLHYLDHFWTPRNHFAAPMSHKNPGEFLVCKTPSVYTPHTHFSSGACGSSRALPRRGLRDTLDSDLTSPPGFSRLHPPQPGARPRKQHIHSSFLRDSYMLLLCHLYPCWEKATPVFVWESQSLCCQNPKARKAIPFSLLYIVTFFFLVSEYQLV
jgi:hypothetical protein